MKTYTQFKMKLNLTIILLIFTLSFLAAQTEKERNTATLLNNRALEQKDLNQGILLLDEAIATSSSDFIFYFNRATLKQKLQQYKAALVDFNKCLMVNPSFTNAVQQKGFTEVELGMYDIAAKTFARLIELEPNVAEHYASQAMAYKHSGNHVLTIKYMTKAIALENNPIYYQIRGNSYFQLKNLTKAYDDLGRVLENDSLNHEAYFTRGAAAFGLEKYDLALVNAIKAIKLNPNSFEYNYLKGMTNVKLKKRKEAIIDFEKVIELNPTHSLSLFNLATQNHEVGQLDTALSYYKKSIELTPNDAKIYHGRAITHINLNDYESAIEDLKTAKKVDVRYAQKNQLDLLLNPLLDKVGNYSQGSSYKIESDNPEHYFLQGNLKFEAKRYREAITNFENAIGLDTTFLKALNGAGLAYAYLNEFPKAFEYLKKAIELDGDQEMIHYNLGWAYFQTKQYDKATKSLDTAISLKPHFPKAYFYRGQAKEQLDQLLGAKEDIEKAMKQKMEFPEAEIVLKQINKKLKKRKKK